jgi:hypothetical protein
LLVIFLLILLVAACRPAAPTAEETGQVSLATPKVPPLAQIDAAENRWENSNSSSYFIEVTENTIDSSQKVRVVVSGGQVWAAQRVEEASPGEWGKPEALPLEAAQNYTVEGLFNRIRQQVLGQGPSPANLQATFNTSLGYPMVVNAEALPFRDDQGTLVLNRRYSYDLTAEVKVLLEDTFNPGRETILTLIRSGGPEAWCDKLRLFEDGSSVYTDECRREVLQLTLPGNRLAELNELRSAFARLEAEMQAENQFQRLVIQGRGADTAGQAQLEKAWELAAVAHDLLSEPIGLGLTLVYTHDNRIMGFDTLNEHVQPARVRPVGELHGAALSPDARYLAFGDEEGLRVLDIESGNITQILPPPESGYYRPREWGSAGLILLTHVPAADGEFFRHGWASVAEPSWHDLPLPEDAPGYGCDSGAAWAPRGARLTITGLEVGSACNTSPGLTIIDLTAGTAERIVAPLIQSGQEEAGALRAGAHSPAWSRDGAWIAFGLDQDASQPLAFPTRLYRARPDGSDLTPLTNNAEGMAAYPAWSPDGIVYYGLSGLSVEHDGIYGYDSNTNEHSLVVGGSDLRPISISPDGQFLLYAQEGGLYLWGFLRQSATEVVPPQEGAPAEFVGWINSAENGNGNGN